MWIFLPLHLPRVAYTFLENLGLNIEKPAETLTPVYSWVEMCVGGGGTINLILWVFLCLLKTEGFPPFQLRLPALSSPSPPPPHPSALLVLRLCFFPDETSGHFSFPPPHFFAPTWGCFPLISRTARLWSSVRIKNEAHVIRGAQNRQKKCAYLEGDKNGSLKQKCKLMINPRTEALYGNPACSVSDHSFVLLSLQNLEFFLINC